MANWKSLDRRAEWWARIDEDTGIHNYFAGTIIVQTIQPATDSGHKAPRCHTPPGMRPLRPK